MLNNYVLVSLRVPLRFNITLSLLQVLQKVQAGLLRQLLGNVRFDKNLLMLCWASSTDIEHFDASTLISSPTVARNVFNFEIDVSLEHS